MISKGQATDDQTHSNASNAIRTAIAVGSALALVALTTQVARADQTGSGTLTDVANAFRVTSGGWIATALGYARHLFFVLVAIELAWTAITYVLQRDNLPDFVANVVLKLMSVFFFLALLQNGPTWIPAIVESFSQAGATISGQTTVLDPSSTFGQGLELAKNVLGTLNNPAIFTAILPVLLAVFCSVGVIVAYAIVAGQLMVTLIESYIVISAGLFFLGFSGSRWTLPFSERYVGYAVSVGVKLFMLYLTVGLGATLAQRWQALFTPGAVAAPEIYVGVAGSALVFMLLGWQIPNLAAALMNGSPAMTLGAAGNVVSSTVSAGGGALVAAGLGAGSAVAAAAALTGRIAGNSRRDQSIHNGASRPIGFIEPAPRHNESNRQSSTDGSTDRSSVTKPQTSSADPAHPESTPDSKPLGSDAAPTTTGPPESSVSPTGITERTQDLPGSPAMPSLDDVAAQLATSGPGHKTAPSRTAGPVLEMIRNLRIPTLPHDAASGSIHIRFKHHDGD